MRRGALGLLMATVALDILALPAVVPVRPLPVLFLSGGCVASSPARSSALSANRMRCWWDESSVCPAWP